MENHSENLVSYGKLSSSEKRTQKGAYKMGKRKLMRKMLDVEKGTEFIVMYAPYIKPVFAGTDKDMPDDVVENILNWSNSWEIIDQSDGKHKILTITHD